MLLGFPVLLFTAWLAVSAAIFFTRLWPRRKHAFFGNDTWSFLLEAREIKRNNWSPPHKINTRILDEPLDYPLLFHYLVALLPEKNVASRVRFIPPFLDSLHALLLMLAAFWLSQNLVASVLAGAFVILTTSAVSDSFTLTARPFSALLYSLLVVCLLAAVQNAWFYAAAAVVFALILLGHKMATQFSFSSLLLLTLLEKNFWYAGVLLSGFVLAVAASRGYYFKVLRSHAAILDFWRRNISKRRPFGFAKWLAYSLAKIVFNPWVFFAAAFYLTTPLTPELRLLWSVLVVAISLFVVTAFKPFAFLGENQRYLQYSFLASFPAAALFIASNGFLVQLLAALAFAASFFVTKSVWDKIAYTEGLARDESLLECINFLRKRRESRLWCLTNAGSMIAWFTGKRILVSGSPTNWRTYPFLIIPPSDRELPQLVKRVSKEFGVQLVVASKERRLTPVGKKVFENDAYCVFKVG